MKAKFVRMLVVLFLSFTFTVKGQQKENGESAGCTTSGEKINIKIEGFWVEEKIRFEFKEIILTNLDQFHVEGVWSEISYNGVIVACQKATFFQNWDGERSTYTEFKEGSFPEEFEHRCVIQLMDKEGFSFYVREGDTELILPPKEFAPLPEQFEGVKMISPPIKEPQAIPRPKSPGEKPKRKYTDPNRKELA